MNNKIDFSQDTIGTKRFVRNLSPAQGKIEKFFRKKFSERSIAQGTIEYLVILAVVVVIGLVVVSLLASTTDTQNLATTTGRIDTQTRSGIVITDAAIDLTGDSFLVLRNNNPEEKTLTKITIDDTENFFDEKIMRGQEIVISLKQLETNCKCEAGETTKTCTYQIEFNSRYGITTTQNQQTTITCEEKISPSNPQNVIGLGDGSIENPFQITSCQELQNINEKLDANFILISNLDCGNTLNWNNGAGWVPIGTNENPFIGNLNGQNRTINGIHINRPSDNNLGLFGYNNGTIQNINLNNYNITGNSHVGAIAGRNFNGIIEKNYSTGNLVATSYIGGIVGTNHSIVKNNYSSGNINGNGITGGITGWSNNLIQNNYSDINIASNTGNFNGGIVGYNQTNGIVEKNYFLGKLTITGTGGNGWYTGGIAGYNNTSGIIQNNFVNTIIQTNNQYTGGIVGTSNGASSIIQNNYSLGTINGGVDLVGGIIGFNSGSIIRNNFSTAQVTSPGTMKGGIAGFNLGGTLTNNYTSLSICVNNGSATGCNINEPETNFYLKTHPVYNESPNWDFETIWITQDNNYPILR